MSAVAAFDFAPGSFARVAARVALVALALWAIDAVADSPLSSIEINASTVPRFDALTGATHSSHVDLTMFPQQDSGFGLAFGLSSAVGASGAFGSNASALPSLDLGLHWRYALDRTHRFDVTAYRRMPSADAISMIESREPSYGARVEMGLASSNVHKGFVADHGFIGFQLESGARLTVKRTGGVPMLYYRNQF